MERTRLPQLRIAGYPPRSDIAWHRDAPMFGSPVKGVSLQSWCTMHFCVKRERFERNWQELAPRSLYLLDRASRTQWQHSIPVAPELRCPIIMRTLRGTKTPPPLA